MRIGSSSEANVRRGSWVSAAMATALIASSLAGCGGGGGSPTGGTPPPTRTRTVLGNTSWQALGIPQANALGLDFDFAGPLEVTISPNGDMDAVVDWTFASNDVHLYLTSSTCTDQQFYDVQCSIMRHTEGLTSKPRTLNAPGLNGNYRVWVVNFGSSNESGTLQIGVTR